MRNEGIDFDEGSGEASRNSKSIKNRAVGLLQVFGGAALTMYGATLGQQHIVDWFSGWTTESGALENVYSALGHVAETAGTLVGLNGIFQAATGEKHITFPQKIK